MANILRHVDPSIKGAELKYRYLKEQPTLLHGLCYPSTQIPPAMLNAQSSLMLLIPNISTGAVTSTVHSLESVMPSRETLLSEIHISLIVFF
jgi:hypothetical protein